MENCCPYTIKNIVAGESIPAYSPVAIIDGIAYAYDSSNTDHIYAYAGFSTRAVSAGNRMSIQQIGLIRKQGWGLTPNVPYYAGVDGSIHTTDSPPGFVFRKIVGFSVDANTMMIVQYMIPYSALIVE